MMNKIDIQYQDIFLNWRHLMTKHHLPDAYRTATNRAKSTFNGQEIVNEVKLIISRFKEINNKNPNWFDYAITSFSDEEHIKNISNYMVKTSSRSYDPLLRFTNKRLPVTQL